MSAMTSSARSLSTQIPQTQNTAPVVEFRCLYTRDLRRKAKRWQDGFLRYHTFNRRVMVYDTLRSFIGDTFNPSGADLQEGDEIDLEKDFVMVQVTEPLGTTRTDLTELIEQRNKHKTASTNSTPARNRVSQESISGPYQKHRSLTALLGTPKGPIGKAVMPTLSPFEERQKRKAHIDHGISKRQKQSTAPAVVHRAPVYTNSSQGSSPTRQVSALTPRTRPAQRRASPPVVIELSSDTISRGDGISSSPPIARSSDVVNSVSNRHHQAPPRSPSSRPAAVAVAEDSPDKQRSPSPKRKPLKVISNAPRKMLLCQQTTKRQEKRVQDPVPKDTAPARLQADMVPMSKSVEEQPLAPHQQRLKDRLARIGQKKISETSSTANERSREILTAPSQAADSTRPSAPQPVTRTDQTSRRVFNEAAANLSAPEPAQPSGAPTKSPLPAPEKSIVNARSLSVPVAVVPEAPKAIIAKRPVEAALEKAPSHPPPRAQHNAGVFSLANPQPAPRSLGRSDSDPLLKPFKPPTRPETRATSKKAVNIEPLQPTTSANPLDSGPWSREAMDLFDWWPPDRDKQGNKITKEGVKV